MCRSCGCKRQPDYCHHSRHLYVLRIVPERLTISRDQFIEELKARNVGVSVHFIALHTMSAYARRFGYKPEDFPKAYAFSESEISLPMYSDAGREERGIRRGRGSGHREEDDKK